MVGCCAPGCSRRTENGVRLFGFPIDPKRRKQWLIMTNRPHWTPTMHSKLCQFHFEDRMFKRKEPNWRLKPNAIPTLFHHYEYLIDEMLQTETFSSLDSVNTLLSPEPTPELAAHDHSYISLKKIPSEQIPHGSQSLLPPVVGEEVEIPSEIVQGRLIANFEDYQIIQTVDPSSTELIFNDEESGDMFTINESSGSSQVIHHMLPPEDDEGVSPFQDSEIIATVELNDMGVVEGSALSSLVGTTDHLILQEEEEVEEREAQVLIQESTPIETGPTVNVSSCDDLCFRLRVTLSTLKTALAKVTKERDTFKNKLRKEKRKTKLLEKQLCNTPALPSFLQDDQLKYLQKGSHRGFAWSEETIKQANELKTACGTRGYIALLMHNFPLPGLSTLRSNRRKETGDEEDVIEEETSSSNVLNAELSLQTDDIDVS